MKVDVLENTVVGEITVKAPRETVWRALTEPKTFGKWFCQGATGTKGVGQLVTMNFDNEHYKGQAKYKTTRIEPMDVFEFQWHIGKDRDFGTAPDEEATTVTFTFSDAEGGTKVRVVESGFERLPVEFRQPGIEDHTEGWTFQLEALRTYSESDKHATMEQKVTEDEIWCQMDLKAPQERVWKAIATAEGMASWFAPGTRGDFVPGGVFVLDWTENGWDAYDAVIEEMDPIDRMVFRWAAYGAGSDGEYLVRVEIKLTTIETGTRLTLSETGFAKIPVEKRADALKDNSGGWKYELAQLAEVVED